MRRREHPEEADGELAGLPERYSAMQAEGFIFAGKKRESNLEQ